MTINDITDDFNFRGSDVVTVVVGYAPATVVPDSLLPSIRVVAGPTIQIFNNGQINIDWDGVWDFQVTRNDDGWVVEYQIPFNTLRFSNES